MISEVAQVIVNDIIKAADYQDDSIFISEISDDTIARCRFWYTRIRFHISIDNSHIIIQYYGGCCRYPVIEYTNITNYLDCLIEKSMLGESHHGSISSSSNI